VCGETGIARGGRKRPWEADGKIAAGKGGGLGCKAAVEIIGFFLGPAVWATAGLDVREGMKKGRTAIAVQPCVLAAMAYQAPSAIALRAARPDSGIRFRSPRFLARSVAILARALALRLASIWSARSKASAVSGDLRIMEFPK
jgi:hypothetical protein